MVHTMLPAPAPELTQLRKASRELLLRVLGQLNQAKLKSYRHSHTDSASVEWNIVSLRVGQKMLYLDTSLAPGSANLKVAVRLDHDEKQVWTVNPGAYKANELGEEFTSALLAQYRDQCRLLGETFSSALMKRLKTAGLKADSTSRISGGKRVQVLALKSVHELRVDVISSASGLKIDVCQRGRSVRSWQAQVEYFDQNMQADQVLAELIQLIGKN